MKKRLTKIMLLFASFFLLAPAFAVAYDPFEAPCNDAPDSAFCRNVDDQADENRIVGPEGIITKATQIFVFLTGAISVIVIIIGGLKYTLANGDSNAVQSAKNTILYAVIGLFVAIFAQTITVFVLERL
jgi:hypothetical protein